MEPLLQAQPLRRLKFACPSLSPVSFFPKFRRSRRVLVMPMALEIHLALLEAPDHQEVETESLLSSNR